MKLAQIKDLIDWLMGVSRVGNFDSKGGLGVKKTAFVACYEKSRVRE